MSEDTVVTFTPDEISRAAQSNATSLALGAMAFCKDHHLPITELVSAWGRRFAPLWAKEITALEMAEGAALNWVSVGSRLSALSGDASHGKAVITGWPSEASLAAFGLSQAEADILWSNFGPIAESHGLSYHWQRQGDEVTMTFTKKLDPPAHG
jgi:hypothetical protein